jgi:hypothetical protein
MHGLPKEAEFEQTWQKLFDLSLIEDPSATWWNPQNAGPPPSMESQFRLQAVVANLLPRDVAGAVDDW